MPASSGQSGTATVTLQVPGGGPAPGRQVRFDVVAGPYGIVATNAAPTTPTVASLAVFSDASGKAQVIIRANVDAPTQPAHPCVPEAAIAHEAVNQDDADAPGALRVEMVVDRSPAKGLAPPEGAEQVAALGDPRAQQLRQGRRRKPRIRAAFVVYARPRRGVVHPS